MSSISRRPYNSVNYQRNNLDCDICGQANKKGRSFHIQQDSEGQAPFEFVWICQTCLENYKQYKNDYFCKTSDATIDYNKKIDKIIELENLLDEYEEKLTIITDFLQLQNDWYQEHVWKQRYEREHPDVVLPR